jgi:hypothetical protein
VRYIKSDREEECPLSKTDDFVVQKLKEETLIYDLKTNKAICLNETAAIVWEMCDGKTSVSEITRKLSKKLKKPITDDLVWLAIDQLNQEGLINNGIGKYKPFEGLSRREIIRKVGFTSIVALPIISAVVAPNAAAAQSGMVGPLNCTDPNNLGAGCMNGDCRVDPAPNNLQAAINTCPFICHFGAGSSCVSNSVIANNCLQNPDGSAACDCVCT